MRRRTTVVFAGVLFYKGTPFYLPLILTGSREIDV